MRATRTTLLLLVLASATNASELRHPIRAAEERSVAAESNDAPAQDPLQFMQRSSSWTVGWVLMATALVLLKWGDRLFKVLRVLLVMLWLGALFSIPGHYYQNDVMIVGLSLIGAGLGLILGLRVRKVVLACAGLACGTVLAVPGAMLENPQLTMALGTIGALLGFWLFLRFVEYVDGLIAAWVGGMTGALGTTIMAEGYREDLVNFIGVATFVLLFALGLLIQLRAHRFRARALPPPAATSGDPGAERRARTRRQARQAGREELKREAADTAPRLFANKHLPGP